MELNRRTAAAAWITPVAGAGLICAAAVTFSILFVDQPVERWVATRQFSHQTWMVFNLLAAPSLLPLPCACAYLVFYALRRASGRSAAQPSLLLWLSIAVAVATMAKDELKWLIGRPWPFTWVKYGIYHIQPFTDDALFGSFPSGHTAYIAAPMFVLWWGVPRWRPLWLAIVFSVMVGLVLSGHHFVADVISGMFLGMAAAAGTIAVGAKAVPAGAAAARPGLPFTRA